MFKRNKRKFWFMSGTQPFHESCDSKVCLLFEFSSSKLPFFVAHLTGFCVDHQYGGISTSVQVDEASTIVTLDDYVDGMATVRIINHTTSDEVAYHQRPFEQRR